MQDTLQNWDSGDATERRIVTGEKYGDEVGYTEYYELETMDGTTYKISPNARKYLLETESAFYEIQGDIFARHQIKKVTHKKSYFGPREGGA